MGERHQYPTSARCEHCRHQPEFAGCLPTLLGCVLVVLLVWGFLANYRWTSIEDGCLVERRFELTWDDGDDSSSATERVCTGG